MLFDVAVVRDNGDTWIVDYLTKSNFTTSDIGEKYVRYYLYTYNILCQYELDMNISFFFNFLYINVLVYPNHHT